MNVSDAVRAHANWKVKLTSYLMNPDGSLDPVQVSKDNCCDLGKWIYGEARHHHGLPEMQELRTTHAAFHRSAAAVIRAIDNGTERDQNKLTGFSSEFGVLSLKIVHQLKSLAGKIGLAA